MLVLIYNIFTFFIDSYEGIGVARLSGEIFYCKGVLGIIGIGTLYRCFFYYPNLF